MSALSAYTAYLKYRAGIEAEVSESKGGAKVLTARRDDAVLTVTFRRTHSHVEPQPDTIIVTRGGKVTAYQRGQLVWAVADLTGRTSGPAPMGAG